ncbi:MAG: hypothetical protein ACKO13_17355 [Cytophagales bacterium]
MLVAYQASSQFKYGVQLQNFGGSRMGGVVADSISVLLDSRASINVANIPAVGLFLEYKPAWKLPLFIRSEFNYRSMPIGLGISIYNGKSFGGKPDAVYTYKTLNFAFDLPVNIYYNIIHREKFSVLNLRYFEVGLMAGFSIQFNGRGEGETYPIAKNFNSPGMSDVNFAIYNTIKTINFFYDYGIRVRLGHFVATYRRDFLLTRSATNDLEVWGNTYSFRTTYDYQSISLGYTFNFKKANK